MNMKRFLRTNALVAVAFLGILVAFTSGGDFLNAAVPPANKKILLTSAQHQMLENSNDFACNLLRTINSKKKRDESIIMSPISVAYLLGMLNEGAEGVTRRQITDVLGMDGTAREINMYFMKMTDEAPKVDPKVTLKIANCIDVNSALNINLNAQYEANMRKYYHAQVDEMDFTNHNNVDIINNWCDIHTNGMIPMILDKLDPDAAMYLLNAVYFKATWTEKFDPSGTRDMNFTKEDGTTVNLKMMHRQSKAAYGSNDLCEMLCMPYGNDGYSMYVLLPQKGKTVNDIIQSLSAKTLKKQQTLEMVSHDVDILIPRFTTESETNLKDILSSMGMPKAFDRFTAEFPNMATKNDRQSELYVSMMLQKAKIEVDEDGTKAAAVTVARMTTRSAMVSSRYTFHATHPFVYYIVENSTGTIFFMGTYCGD